MSMTRANGKKVVPNRAGRCLGRQRRVACSLLLLAAVMALPACKPPPQSQYSFDSADQAKGAEIIERVGCGACHEIPGIDWPEGRIGPSLRGFDDIGLIAGALPNTPENLAWFIRNAPEAKPGSTMPPMPVTEQEAQHVAAFLYGIDHD